MSTRFIIMVILFGFLTPFMYMKMYKTFVYLENYLFFENDVNILLSFMTLTVLLMIVIATPNMSTYYYVLHLSLCIVLVSCFTVNNMLLFYILFESSLIPILLMIVGWGYQPERLQAGLYMILYTVLGSFPLLVVILLMKYNFVSMNYMLLSTFNNYSVNYLIFSLGFMAFLIKLPVYSMHVWLPKAHVEAPLGGSMILAAVLLKLGGYGLYILSGIIVMPLTATPLSLIICLSLWGGLIASLVCMIQSDIKAMIAYSSIVHMSIVVLGFLSGTVTGLFSAIITMLAHGWASSGLFLVAHITYSVVGSRSFLYSKGLLSIFPTLSLSWFIFCIINMSVPPTINFLGELMAIPAAMFNHQFLFIVLLMIMFISVSYNMLMYSKINHGSLSSYLKQSPNINSSYMMALVGHVLTGFLVMHLKVITFFTVICKSMNSVRHNWFTKSML
uniref:NADH-ubiquinone oxidoreductase chain 4 n=1 Tax=Camaenella platyodon TaxID=2566149 RepID=A0A4D6SX99_9EUPU|nr:NADH dehydrogenase subunit 4 [Camaenella platyodon]